MTEEQLKAALTKIYADCMKNKDIKSALAKATQTGMRYQTEKIKEGIDIVFKEL